MYNTLQYNIIYVLYTYTHNSQCSILQYRYITITYMTQLHALPVYIYIQSVANKH